MARKKADISLDRWSAPEQVDQDHGHDHAIGRLADPEDAPGQGEVAIVAGQAAAEGRQAPDPDPRGQQAGPPVAVAQAPMVGLNDRVADQEDRRQEPPRLVVIRPGILSRIGGGSRSGCCGRGNPACGSRTGRRTSRSPPRDRRGPLLGLSSRSRSSHESTAGSARSARAPRGSPDANPTRRVRPGAGTSAQARGRVATQAAGAMAAISRVAATRRAGRTDPQADQGPNPARTVGPPGTKADALKQDRAEDPAASRKAGACWRFRRSGGDTARRSRPPGAPGPPPDRPSRPRSRSRSIEADDLAEPSAEHAIAGEEVAASPARSGG